MNPIQMSFHHEPSHSSLPSKIDLTVALAAWLNTLGRFMTA
jgi:hypothetical protein